VDEVGRDPVRRRPPPPQHEAAPQATRMRPANIVVPVTDGNVDHALKMLKKKMVTTGLLALLKHQSRMFAYTKPSMQRRLKAIKARGRARKLERAQRRQYAWIDGDRRTPPP
jgi:ribosomal protein S21